MHEEINFSLPVEGSQNIANAKRLPESLERKGSCQKVNFSCTLFNGRMTLSADVEQEQSASVYQA